MTRLLFKSVKKFLSLFPPTWPFRIYNFFLKIPVLQRLMGWILHKITPDRIQIEEGQLIFDRDDPVMSGAISFGRYEPTTVSLFRAFLKPGMNVIDIGANLGYFTIIASGRVGTAGKVFSFEPDPRNFALLRKNIAVNQLKNVEAVQIALSDRAGKRELFFGDNQCTLSFGDKKGRGRSETVITDTLDNSLRVFGSPRIDIVKMDIEGAEPIAFEGMKETISKNPNLTMFFEYHPNAIKRCGRSPLDFLRKIENLGYSISVIDEDRENRLPVRDIATFDESFGGKEMSMNLIAEKEI